MVCAKFTENLRLEIRLKLSGNGFILGFIPCLKIYNYDLANKLKNDMRSRGLKLDITAYGVFIDGYCKRRDMESARQLFDELYAVGLSPITIVYNSMISGFKSLNAMDTALILYNKMIPDGFSVRLGNIHNFD